MNNIRRRPEGALLRTYLSAAGLSPESFSKPLIGILTCSTQLFSEKPDARELGEVAAAAVEKAQGVPVRWDTMKTPEMMSWGHAESYNFAWRDQFADLVEGWTRDKAIEGLVLIADAPESLVGMAMAAARLNLPAIIVPMRTDRWEYAGPKTDSGTPQKKGFQDPYELMVETLFPKKKGEEATAVAYLENCLLSQDDHSTNAIYLVLEALGLCMPGISTLAPKSNKLKELTAISGSRVVQLVSTGFALKRVLSHNAFMNGIRLNAALGGTVDATIHLLALAHESGVPLSIDEFDKVRRETPQLCFLGGVGQKEPKQLDDLDKAGGVWAVMHGLKNHVLPTNTICSKGASELAKSATIKDTHVIMVNRPYHKKSGVVIFKGNLSPNGAVAIENQIHSDFKDFKGPAAIFESEMAAVQAINKGEVEKGSVLVVRGQGPRGGPGLKKLRLLPPFLERCGLAKSMPVITDGQFPEAPTGLFISLVSPEGAANGPLSVLKNEDVIAIDVPNQQLAVRLTETELNIRYARWQAPENSTQKGFLARYRKLVSEAHEGAVLK